MLHRLRISSIRPIACLVFHHTIDDVYKSTHNADQGLGFRLAFADLPQEVFAENRVVRFAAVGADRDHADGQKVEQAA